jgi:hypothetical protein
MWLRQPCPPGIPLALHDRRALVCQSYRDREAQGRRVHQWANPARVTRHEDVAHGKDV